MKKTLLALVVALAMTVTTPTAPEVTLRSSPAFQWAPGYVRLTLVLEQDDRNRAVCVIYDGGDGGITCREVAGSRFPRTTWFDLKRLSAGQYVAEAQVQRNDGSVIYSDQTRWSVLAPGMEP